MRLRPGALLLQAVLLLGAVVALVPMAWMISASLMPTGEANSFPPPFWPSRVTLEHYAALFTGLRLGRYLLNSTLIALSATTLCLLCTSLAGYAFAKLRFRGRDLTFRLLLVAMVIPAQVTMLPLFLELKQFGLVNSYVGVLIPYLAPIYGIFLVRQYALSIPDDLLDAARLDGAGEFRIYWQVVLPILGPALVTLGIFTFLSTWNDFMWPLIILSDESRHTLPVALARLSGEHVQDTELMMAGSVVTVLPVLVAFVLLQRQYIQGIMAGSVKE